MTSFDETPVTGQGGGPSPWWRNATFYQVYPRSFADSDGDGVGDLDGVVAHLGHLAALGIDAVWLSPVMVSPMADHGYDVADPRDVDALFGGIAALDRLVAAAHDRGIRITMDLVPNHTSSAHRWFVDALASAPGSAARARYHFRDGVGPGGDAPPNNWLSVFGGPAWTRTTDADGTPGQWYLHLFDTAQPDLNWDNPEVAEDLATTLRFWCARGIDGFRIDVAHGMAKPEGLPDMAVDDVELLRIGDDDPRFDNPAVHDIHRGIRRVLDDYPGTVSVGEVWVADNTRFAAYVRPDELHLGFNFRLQKAAFDAAEVRDAVENSLAAVALVDAEPTWCLDSHDAQRSVTRYGDGAAGVARARAMALLMLALPGTVFVYNGEELGLPNVTLPDEALQDPTWERSGHTVRGRDGCRVPLPWDGDVPPYGFSDTADTWLPMPGDWAPLTVAAQDGVAGSTLELFRDAIRLRREHLADAVPAVEFADAPPGCLRLAARGGSLEVLLNASDAAIALPDASVLLASAPLSGGMLPPDTAVWLAR